MKNILFLITFCVPIFFSACKNGTDAKLLDALAIQDEAIHIGLDLDKMIKEMMVADPSVENLSKLGSIRVKIEQWRIQMVPVPGVKHKHDHGESDDHDHEAHVDHEHHHKSISEEIASHLSPFEIKEIQVEWKKEIDQLKSEVDNYKKEISKN
ncbi:MAG: hypothetical protein WAT79_10750 [Saprospiraceae bacterium]